MVEDARERRSANVARPEVNSVERLALPCTASAPVVVALPVTLRLFTSAVPVTARLEVVPLPAAKVLRMVWPVVVWLVEVELVKKALAALRF